MNEFKLQVNPGRIKITFETSLSGYKSSTAQAAGVVAIDDIVLHSWPCDSLSDPGNLCFCCCFGFCFICNAQE